MEPERVMQAGVFSGWTSCLSRAVRWIEPMQRNGYGGRQGGKRPLPFRRSATKSPGNFGRPQLKTQRSLEMTAQDAVDSGDELVGQAFRSTVFASCSGLCSESWPIMTRESF